MWNLAPLCRLHCDCDINKNYKNYYNFCRVVGDNVIT